MKRILLIILILFGPLQLMAQKRAFTIDDLYKIKSVLDPHYSPDNRQIVFSVTGFSLAEGTSSSDIFLVSADGARVSQMTRDSAADYHPRFSADGHFIYFSSSRSGSVQLWKIPVDGGEAQQVTDFATGVADPIVSGDGRYVVFYSEVFPECGADSECNKKLAMDLEKSPTQAELSDELFYRHWNFWKGDKRLHTVVFDTQDGSYRDLTPGRIDMPTYTAGGHSGFALSTTATEVCVAANADSNHWETTNKDLWLIPVAGGTPVNITDDNEAYDGRPDYSPDGRFIAYLRQEVPIYEADVFRLAIYDRKSGNKRILTPDFDYWITEFHWSKDSRQIYFEADVEGRTPIYRLDLKSGKITEMINFDTVDGFSLSADGKSIVAARRSVHEPREIWSASLAAQNKVRLTNFNKAVEDEVDIRPAEEMWIPSSSGKKIHTFIVKPHDFDPSKSYPLVLNVHGGPQSQWTDGFRGDWQVYPGAGYVVAFPNPHGSSGYGQEFTLAISGDWGGKVYEDVLSVTDSLSRLPWIDGERMGSMGWSYGGYMMMWMNGHTDRFKAQVCMMGIYDLTSFYGSTEELWFPNFDLGGAAWESEDYTKWSPHLHVNQFKTPSLVITGEKDFRVSYTQSLEYFTALQRKGVPSRLLVFKNDGHWPNWVRSMPLYYNAHLEWFHKYLGGAKAPYDSKDIIRDRAY